MRLQRARLAILGNRALPRDDARAIHQNALHAMLRTGGREGRIDRIIAGDITHVEEAADFTSHAVTPLGIEIQQRHLHAEAREMPGGGLAQAGCAAGDYGGNGGIELHGGVSPVMVVSGSGSWYTTQPRQRSETGLT